MRAERLLRILHLLQAHRQVTAGELARRLEVSTRTIQRDLDALSLAGVPLYANRGRSGGWALTPGYRASLTGLTAEETMTVFLGRGTSALADLGMDGAARTAVLKLLSTLPAAARADAEFARSRILVDHAHWPGLGKAAPWLAVLQRAVWQDERVTVRYGSTPAPFTVDPLGLVAKGSTWYLLARRGDGEVRTYRVSRVEHAEPAGETFTRPAGFDLAAEWERVCAGFAAALPTYPVRLRVRTGSARRLSWAPGAAVTSVTELDGGSGWSRAEMTFENVFEATGFLLGLAGQVVVEEPAELRDRLLDAARSLVALHTAATGG